MLAAADKKHDYVVFG